MFLVVDAVKKLFTELHYKTLYLKVIAQVDDDWSGDCEWYNNVIL